MGSCGLFFFIILFNSFSQKGPLLGSVGSFDWAGGAFLYMSNGKATFINKTRVNSDMNDAYLGKLRKLCSPLRSKCVVYLISTDPADSFCGTA